MRRKGPCLCVAVLLVACASAWAQTSLKVSIGFTSHKTCLLHDVDVPCSDVGATLRAQRVPIGSRIEFVGYTPANFDSVASAVNSLNRAGYPIRIGFVTNEVW
jgi:hypothetical protein